MRKPRILVVDDDLSVLKLLLRTLGDLCDVMVLPTGFGIQDMIEHFKPDLIIMDVGLPEDDGYKICREVRQDAYYDSIAVLFLSGLDLPEAVAEAMRAGGDAFMGKPFDAHTLQEAIDKLISQRQAAKPLPQISCR